MSAPDPTINEHKIRELTKLVTRQANLIEDLTNLVGNLTEVVAKNAENVRRLEHRTRQ